MPDTATVGHNLPETDVDPLVERLHETHADLIKRRDELLGAVERAPEDITDEDTAGKMADFVDGQINKFLKRAKVVHQGEKEPFLIAGRTVDGFWHFLSDDLEDGKKALNARRKKYADKKAAEERKRREEEARLAREAEERARKEAEERAAALKADEDLDAAIAAEEAAETARREAEEAAKRAAAKPAELGRSRGDYGGMTTLKQFWNFRNLDRDRIDLEALRDHIPHDAIERAVKSWINANKDNLKAGKQIVGVEIFEDTRL